ncbi:uncharacterized protein [Prorops nasuta]|uniref:uncharacterized protein n=1 Tax=Prorops nasuta TaxID=863751 RepID=UPI0034CD593B
MPPKRHVKTSEVQLECDPSTSPPPQKKNKLAGVQSARKRNVNTVADKNKRKPKEVGKTTEVRNKNRSVAKRPVTRRATTRERRNKQTQDSSTVETRMVDDEGQHVELPEREEEQTTNMARRMNNGEELREHSPRSTRRSVSDQMIDILSSSNMRNFNVQMENDVEFDVDRRENNVCDNFHPIINSSVCNSRCSNHAEVVANCGVRRLESIDDHVSRYRNECIRNDVEVSNDIRHIQENDCTNDPIWKLTNAIESTLRAVQESTVSEGNSHLVNRLTSAKALPIFSGDPMEWMHFKESFELTSELAGYTPTENVSRLFSALQGEAREAVQALLGTGRDAQTIMQTLEMLFGNKKILAHKIVKDLQDLPAICTGEISLMRFAAKLKNAVSTFKSLKLTGYLYNPELVQGVAKKLPSALKYDYNKYTANILEDKAELEKLADYLYREAELAVAGGIFDNEIELTDKFNLQNKQSTRTKANKMTTAVTSALLKIVAIEILGSSSTIKTFAMLDDGSTITLINKDIANRLGITGTSINLEIKGLNDREIVSACCEKVIFRINGEFEEFLIKNAIAVPGLCLPSQTLSKELVRLIAKKENIFIQPYDNIRPEILIGQDNWQLLTAFETRAVSGTGVALSSTFLGWIVHGVLDQSNFNQKVLACANVNTIEMEQDRINNIHGLDDMIKRYFQMDDFGVKETKRPNLRHERVIGILENTTRRMNKGWETGLLWKKDKMSSVDTRKTAFKRLLAQERKIDKDEKYGALYYQEMQRLINMGYARKVNDEETEETNGESLNKQLEQGPDLLQPMPGVIMRFRLHAVAIKADIADMYMRCSAIYVKDRNAELFKETKPDAVRVIKRNCYADDILTSRKTVNEAKKLVQDIIEINAQANFMLHGWASNSQKVIAATDDQAISKDSSKTQIGEKGEERVLGLFWDQETDMLGFNVGLDRVPKEIMSGARKPTKREFLRIIMSVFDPLGLIAPFTLKSKILMQEVWRSGIGWDEQLRDEEKVGWLEWIEHLKEISTCRVPRCVSPKEDTYTRIELHTFCDASLKAYSAAVYTRFILKNETAYIMLVMAKSRIASLKPLSIPRLELQAALLGARLAKTVYDEIEIKIDKRIFWSDSITVIRWIDSEPRTKQVFVAHRLGEINELTTRSEWRWVPTKDNPADCATRWIKEKQNKNSLWFSGPKFLQEKESNWPREKILNDEERGKIDILETKKREHICYIGGRVNYPSYG